MELIQMKFSDFIFKIWKKSKIRKTKTKKKI